VGRSEVIKDAGGTLALSPTETTRASSATLIVYEPGSDTELVASTAATVDTVNTDLDGAAAAGSTALTLTSVSGVAAGVTYLLKNQDLQHEWVEFTGIDSGTRVCTLLEPVEYDYADADTLQGVGLSYALAAAKADTINELYRVVWTYVVGGVSHYARTFFDVVYSKWPDVILRTDEFELRTGRAGSDIMQRAGREGRDFADEIAQATSDVRDDLEATGAAAARFLTHDQFRTPIARRVLLNFAESDDFVPRNWKDDPGGWLHECRAIYRGALDDALARTQTYDWSNDGIVNASEATRKHHVWLSR